MIFEIYIKEIDNIVPFFKSVCPFHNFQKEFGTYTDISGELYFSFERKKVKIVSDSIASDVFSLFYSINDFIEFDFASINLGKDNVFSYEKNNSQYIKINILDFEEIINENIFINTILTISERLFRHLYKLNSNEEYKMYIELIETIKIQIVR